MHSSDFDFFDAPDDLLSAAPPLRERFASAHLTKRRLESRMPPMRPNRTTACRMYVEQEERLDDARYAQEKPLWGEMCRW